MVSAISSALGKDVTAENAVGMNPAFGMEIVLFAPESSGDIYSA